MAFQRVAEAGAATHGEMPPRSRRKFRLPTNSRSVRYSSRAASEDDQTGPVVVGPTVRRSALVAYPASATGRHGSVLLGASPAGRWSPAGARNPSRPEPVSKQPPLVVDGYARQCQ